MKTAPIGRRVAAFTLLSIAAACSSPAPTAPSAAAPSIPPGGCESRFTLQNRSTTSVVEFYFRPAGSSDWGIDRFGSRQLTRGLTMSFRVVGEGRHDLRIVWSNGRESRLDNVNLCQVPLVVAEDDRLMVPSGPTSAAAPPRGRPGARQ